MDTSPDFLILSLFGPRTVMWRNGDMQTLSETTLDIYKKDFTWTTV